jgi:hypothetical protein
MRKILFLFVAFASLSMVSAASTCLTINSNSFDDYMNEIPSISSQLGSCSVLIPSSAQSLISDGNVLISVSTGSGVEQFYAIFSSGRLTSLETGVPASYTHEVLLDESTFDDILGSTDAENEILNGIKTGDIKIVPQSFFGKVKWFFAKFFLPSPSSSSSSSVTGKPENCDETYLQGHSGYAENKELWDSYSADTDNVCQSQYGKGIPSPCEHIVQLSVQGNPYYLCWYNE